MQIRPQLTHHWLLILLLAVILVLGQSLGAWAAPTQTVLFQAATPTPATPGSAGKGSGVEEGILVEDDEVAPIDNLEDAQQAVVQIEAVGTFVDPAEGMQMNAAGAGSGFIIDPDGIAVTNNHVATGAAFLKVFLAGEDEPRNARVLGVSECSDLAVIDIEGDGFSYLTWHEAQVKVGLDVFALGFPLGDPEFTMTSGIISKARADGESSWASVSHVLEHDATINPGNSGGPLVDEEGRIVGINYAGNDETNQYFAIDAADAQSVIEELRAGNDVESIGINGEAIFTEDISGIWVASVASGSPADQTGIKPGDIILTMEGISLATEGTLAEYCSILRSHGPDDVLTVQVLRFDTEEVLEGQINGRELQTSFSIAEQIEEEPATGGEEQSEGTTYADYMTVSDEAGIISVEVPEEWSDVQESEWTIDDEAVGIQLLASPDAEAFYKSWETPGVLFSVSESLAGTSSPEDLLDNIDYSEACKTHGERFELPADGFFAGYYESWEECGDSATVATLVALTPAETQDYVVLLEVYAVTKADLDALDHVLDSFVISNIGDAANTPNEETAPPSGDDINDIVDTSGMEYEYEFVTAAAINALLPADWTDQESGDWEVDGEVLGTTFAAAADLDAFRETWTEPGIYVRTATGLEEDIDVDEWLDELDLSENCTKEEGRNKHNHSIYDHSYTGAFDVWSNCEDTDNAYAYLVAVSEPLDHLVLIEFQAMSDGDVEAFGVLLESFFVDTGETANTSSAEEEEAVDLGQYQEISSDDGLLTVRVPNEWSDISSGDWNLDDEAIGTSLSAATDLQEYNDTWNTPGMFFGVTSEFAGTSVEDFLDNWDYSDDCTYDDRIEYDDSVFIGAYDIWTDCGDEANLFIVLAANPKEDDGTLVLINVAIPADNSTEAFEQILASFVINSGDDTGLSSSSEEEVIEEPVAEESATGFATVVANTLNVREGPGTNYGKLGSVASGDEFSIIGQVDNCAWLLVTDADGAEGWISGAAEFVTIDIDCADIPVAEAPAAPSNSGNATSGNTGSNNSGATSGNASQGCYTFQNHVGDELTITFTKKDGSWNKTFKVAKGSEHEECFDPGDYTYTLSAPRFESGNNEMTISAGDNFYFPVTAEQ